MGEEENKPETGDTADADKKASPGSTPEGEKPEIADRLREMGVMDHKKSGEQTGGGRRMLYVIVGGLVVAAGIVYWLSQDGNEELQVAEMPAAGSPYGWPGNPPPNWGPGTPPPQDGRGQVAPAWPPSGPAQYYGGPPPHRYPGPQYYDQSGAPRQFGPRPPRYYGGPPPFSPGDRAMSDQATETQGDQETMPYGQSPPPEWRQPPTPPSPPARPAWAQPPVNGPYGEPGQNYYGGNPQYGSDPRRFGPPPHPGYQYGPPPGWPREAWRARRPEESGSWEGEAQQSPERPPSDWPRPAPNQWAPQQYGPYGPPPWAYQPVSLESDTRRDNPWGR